MARGRLGRNPFAAVPLPRLEKRLPQFLTEEQAAALLASPQRLLGSQGCDAFTACRDRLAMELLYGAGLRVSELVALNFGSVDLAEGVARVMGKGRKEARVPPREGWPALSSGNSATTLPGAPGPPIRSSRARRGRG